MTKHCSRCKTEQESTEFRLHKCVCKTCERKYALDYFRNRSLIDKEWVETRAKKESQKRREKPELFMLQRAKIRAKEFGLEFNLRLEDISIPAVCPVLGIPLYVNSKQCDNSPTLDRFNNNKGYIKDNVRVISWRANNLKSNASLEELEKIVAYMRS